MNWMSSAVLSAMVYASVGHTADKPNEQQQTYDRAKIINLMAAATYAHDNGNEPAFFGLFSPEGTFRVDDPHRPVVIKAADAGKGPPASSPPSSGGDGPALNKTERPAPGLSHHNISNLHINFTDATHAILHGYYTLIVQKADGSFGIMGMGGYDNQFVKLNGKWKIKDYHVIFGPVVIE
jgi:hypothetical protein